MPIYEYQCSHCGHHLEAMQSIRDEPLKTCPKCNETALEKWVSASAFQLKGTGWYQTDYKTKPNVPQKSDDNKTQSSDNTKDTTASDSKTDTKTEVTKANKTTSSGTSSQDANS